MTSPTPGQQRIAAVQAAHRYKALAGRCRCQGLGEFMTEDEHDAHVAAEVIKALPLPTTQEWAVCYPDDDGNHTINNHWAHPHDTYERAEAETHFHAFGGGVSPDSPDGLSEEMRACLRRGKAVFTRHVTDWTRATPGGDG